jgi:hypothetical protein
MSDESAANSIAGPAPGPDAPPSRKSFPPRVPTLCRLVCQGFEMFFSDRADAPRMPGLIPRAIVGPWWNGVTALCAPEMEKYERRLKTIIGTGEFSEADQLAVELQKRAIDWTNRLLEELDRAECSIGLRQAFENPLLFADLREIARILPLSATLKSHLNLACSLLDEADQTEGLRILDLSPDTVAMLKSQYLSFAESSGNDARYFALALLNRMARPWQILMLGRALAWRPGDAGTRHSEFDAVAQRLVMELQRLGGAIAGLAQGAGTAQDLARDMARLHTLTSRYLDEAEGMEGILAMASQSPWAKAMRETHRNLEASFDRAFLDRVSKVIFDAERRPSPDAAEAAQAGAGFLALLLEHGSRFGLSAHAGDAAHDLEHRIGEASRNLIDAMRASPDHSPFDAHLQAMLRVTEIVFKDGPGAQLARNMRMARQSSAA